MAYGIVDIVTGSTQGIGRAIAESIASHRASMFVDASRQQQQRSNNNNYSLVLVGRNMQRGTQAAQEIHQSTGLQVIAEACDLSDYRQVQQLKGRIAKQMDEDFRIGILVNDAAECPPRQQFVTIPQKQQSDGSSSSSSSIVETKVDKQFASNVLGYHFMIKTFQDKFFSSSDDIDDKSIKSTTTHVVNVASNWAGDLELDDLHFERRRYDNDSAYRQSKQCDRMLTAAWAKRLSSPPSEKAAVVVNACHPGDPCTTLSKALGYNLWSSPPSASMIDNETPIPFLCGFGGKDDVKVTGGWFQGTSKTPCRCSFSHMTKDTESLFEICESFCVYNK